MRRARKTHPTSTPSAGVADLYRQIWRYAKGERLRFVMAIALLTVSQVVKLTVPWFAAQAIDAVEGGPSKIARALVMMAAIIGVYLITWALHGPGRILERNVGLRVRRNLSDALYRKLAEAPLTWHQQHHSSDLQQRVQQSSRALYDFTQSQFMYLQNVVNLVGPLLALTLLSHTVGLVAAFGVAIVGLVITHFDRSLMRLAITENHAERRYAASMLDAIQNVSTVMALRLHEAARGLIGQRLQDVFQPTKRSIELNEAKWCTVDLLTIVLVWGLVGLQAWQMHLATAAQGTILLGSIFMVYQYAQQAGGVIGTFAANFQSFSSIRANVASAEPIWQAPVRMAEHPRDARAWHTLDIQGIDFRYPRLDGKACGVIGAGLTLRAGEHVALVGPSGSGMSTLLHLLAGLYRAESALVRIDGRVEEFMHDLSGFAMLVPQQSEVFEASILDNLTFGLEVSEDDLACALYVSCFDEVLANLPAGLETPICEGGFNLSGGQRQRLALARGILAAARFPVLLLDEPTSALDQATEARVLQRLRERMPQKTVVASVHRLATLCYFDQVALMVDGSVLDCGTLPALTERHAAMRELAGLPLEGEPAS